MKKFSIKKAAILLSIISWSSLFAQEKVGDTLKINEVVITANKHIQSIGNVTQQVDVITSEQASLLVEGNNNLSELLMYTPGAAVSVLSRNDANWGTYGGIGPKYATWMLQGLPIDGFVDPMSLDLEIIDRVEIQRGPASVLYPTYLSQDFAGNQSPLAGTINLIVKEKVDRQETKFSTSYGSYNTLNSQLYHQNNIKNLHYFAGINYEISDYTNYGTEGSWLNMQKNPEYAKTKLYAGATWYYGEQQNNKVSVFIQNTSQTGDAGRVYRGFAHQYTTINITETTHLSEELTFNAGFGMRFYDRTWQSSHFNVIDSLDANDGVNQVIVPVDANLIYQQGIQTLTMGVDYQNASYETYSDPLVGYNTFGNKATAYQYGLYIQDELRIGSLIARGGLRYQTIKNNISLLGGNTPGEPEKDFSRLLWSAGIKYHLSKNMALSANAGNSFMVPGLKSLGGTLPITDQGVAGKNGQLPNPNLKPESGFGVDLGVSMNLGSAMMKARVYHLMIDDAIVENRVSENPSQSQSVNAGNTTSTGVEAEINHQINDHWNWFANATYLSTKVGNDLDPDQEGAEIPFAPDLTMNAGFTWQSGFGLKIFPVVNYTGTYYDNSSKSGRLAFTPGLVINLFAQQRVVSNQHINFDLFGQFYNLSDNRYEMPWQFQNTGFSMMIGFKISFL